MIESHLSGDALADRRADYAGGLAANGDFAAAADLMRQALDLAPLWAAGWATLGLHLAAAARPDEAAKALGQALRLDPADGFGAGLRLAAMGRAPAPAAAPPAFVRGLFDQYAERFDEALVEGLAYRAPDRLLEAILGVAGPAPRWRRALDLGCGTGLMGERLRPLCETLDGVDLSPGMLAKARHKAIYDDLREADILRPDPGGRVYDLVAAADVLNYVGDLAPVFQSVASLTTPGGLFAFTLEAHDGETPFRLGEALRYAHSGTAVEALARQAGFRSRHAARIVLRQDRGAPVDGLAVVVERTASGQA